MITKNRLEIAKQLGFNENKAANLISITALLSRVLQRYNQEVVDYMNKYNLCTNKVTAATSEIDRIANKIYHAVMVKDPKSEEIKQYFFEDFDKLTELIDNFRIKTDD